MDASFDSRSTGIRRTLTTAREDNNFIKMLESDEQERYNESMQGGGGTKDSA